jgi:glyoxylate reductase
MSDLSKLSVRVRPGVPAAGLRRLEAAGLKPEVGTLELQGVDALLCLLTDRIDARLLESAPRLRIAANMAMGTDNVDLQAARALGIAVTNTPGATTDATADMAFALLLAAARNLVWGDRLVRAGGFTGWRPDMGLGLELRGRTLGIVGAGRIGQAVAERARGFGLAVQFARRERLGAHSEPEASVARRAGMPLAQLLETSDVVSLHVPLTAVTRHLIGEAELRRMRRHALLINTSRGAVVDEAALVRALREGWIAGAGLDVYEREPELAPGLAELPNAVLAPHLGSATHATRDHMAEIAADNIVACLAGLPLPNPIVPGRRGPGDGQSAC